jgi:hypothetical protein
MDLLITVLTLVAAVLAITPRERQLDVRVRVRKFDWLLIIASVLLVIALEFYEFLQAHYSWLPPKELWWKGITPKNATYLVVLCAAAILGIRLRWAKLTRTKMQTFRDLIEELYWNENYSELFALLQAHLKDLFRIYRGDFLIPRLQARLNPMRPLHVSLAMVNELREATGLPALARNRNSRLRNLYDRVRPTLSFLGWRIVRRLPANNEASDFAREIVRGIFLSPKFLTALAFTRPYLGLEIIKFSINSFERSDFVDLFVKELLRDPHSVFFREIQNNQNVRAERYDIEDSNRFLHFFLYDVKAAKELGIYKPIGDYVITYLEDFARRPEDDPYNKPYDNDFEQAGAWRSPLFVSVRFFDIMVREALFQNIFWHMWLYYFPLICECVERNYRLDDPLVEAEYEFPTRYAYALYQMFSALRDWIHVLFDLPEDQTNVVLKSTYPSYDENGNIPKSSMIALSRCLYIVLTSKNISGRTKSSLANMVFDLYFDLRASGRFDRYAEVLLTAISEGRSSRKDNAQYMETLAEIFQEEKDEYLIKRDHEHVDYVESVLA